MEIRDDLTYLDCPGCGERIRWPLVVTVQPTFYAHVRPGRSTCRIGWYRHPHTHEIICRVLPEGTRAEAWLKATVHEVRALMGKHR